MKQFKVIDVWLVGSEGTTHIRLEATRQEYQFLKRVRKRISFAVRHADPAECMPTMKVRMEGKRCLISRRKKLTR